MKKTVQNIIPVLLTAIIGCLAFYWIGLYPFGSYSAAWCDMTQQVIPLLCDLKDILSSDQSMFLNFANGGGMNFWGVFLFFLSSPFSFLVAFFEKSDFMMLVNLLILLKMMVCAFTASLFFQKIYPNLDMRITCALSVSYAFCGYTMLFYQNIIWLDMMYLFPLLLLSLQTLSHGKSFVPYTLCLSAMMTVHFHLSFMVLCFIILASGIYLLLFCKQETRGERAASLALGSICAGALTGVVWLPSLLQYSVSARSVSLWTSLAQGSFLSQFHTIGMILVCTISILPAFLYVLMQSVYLRFPQRKKSLHLILFSLMTIPLLIEPINKMWHTGSYQAFPGRYGYITVFLGLILIADLLSDRHKETPKSKWWAIFGGTLLLAALVGTGIYLLIYHKKELSVYTRTLWGSRSFLSAVLIFVLVGGCACVFGYCLYRLRHLSKRMMAWGFLGLTVIQCLFFTMVFFPRQSDFTYRTVQSLAGKIQDEDFYRVKNEAKYYDLNLTGALGYNTLNHYTSFTPEHYLLGMKKLGYSSYWMEVSSVGGTAFSDAVFCNRYSITAGKKDDAIYSNGNLSIVPTPLSLPMGLIVPDTLLKESQLPFAQRVFVNDLVYRKITGTDSYVAMEYTPTYEKNVERSYDGRYRIKRTSATQEAVIEYVIPADSTERTYYFDCYDSLSNNLREAYYGAFTIKVNGEIVSDQYPKQNQNGLLKLTTCKDRDLLITVTVHKNVDVRSFGVFSMDEDQIRQGLTNIPTADLTVGKDQITGVAQASNDGQMLLISIPYDKGFTVWVNGVRTPAQQVLDVYTGVQLQAGENQIRITYSPPGFQVGLILTIFGGLLLVGCGILWARGKLRFASLQKTLYILLIILVCIVFAGLYLMPIAVWMF